MANYLDLFVTRKYQIEGEIKERTQYVKIGACFPHENDAGFGIAIMEGVSVSGNLVALPPRDKSDDKKSRSANPVSR